MEETWIWYGPCDPVSLEDIRQTGATGISTALYEIPAGDIWPLEEILERKAMIESAGLTWSVIESIPVHETIKTGRPKEDYPMLIENYKTSILNAGAAGLDILSYSFSPLFDWLRTDLDYPWHDGSRALRFSMEKFRVFDIHILKRENAEHSYTKLQVDRAASLFKSMSEEERDNLTKVITAGLHGQKAYTVQDLKEELKLWSDLDIQHITRSHFTFLREMLPVADKAGILLTVHPDDPPRSILGLPNILSSAVDFRNLFNEFPTPSLGLTFCLGSLASRKTNNVLEMAEEFADRIRFVHVRNVVLEGPDEDGLIESGHIEGRGDLVAVLNTVMKQQQLRIKQGKTGAIARLPLRSDHGHLFMHDEKNGNNYIPGHSYTGRMRGLCEVRGILKAISMYSS